MSNVMRLALLCVLPVAASCSPHSALLRCDAGLDDSPAIDGAINGRISRITSVEIDSTRATADDNGTAVPLIIQAQVPCLTDGISARVMTSVGTVAGKDPGTPGDVFLSPTDPARYSTLFHGETQLIAPGGRLTRIQVSVADSEYFALVTVPNLLPDDTSDAGPSAGQDAEPAKD